MRKAIVLMAIGILAMIPLTGCTSTPAGDGPATLPPTLTELQQQINGLSSTLSTLNGRVSNLDSAVAGIGTQQAYDDSALKQSIATLQASIDDLVARVVVLEIEEAEEQGNTTAGATRWSFRTCKLVEPIDDVQVIIYDIAPSKIQDEGLYDIELVIENRGEFAADLANAELELTLVPRDYCMVDEDSTYMDSDNDPWLWWDADFVIKTREGQEICKRITFTSERHNFGILEPDEWFELELVLELYYI